MRGMTVLVPVLLAAGAVSCDPGPDYRDFSKIELQPAAHDVQLDLTGLDVGAERRDVFTVIDPGKNIKLCLSGIRLDYTPATADEAANGPALSLELETGTVTVTTPPLPTAAAPLCLAPMNEGWGTLPEAIRVIVVTRRTDDAVARTATLHVVNDNTDDETLQDYQVRFQTKACKPALDVPAELAFTAAAPGTGTVTQELDLTNPSSCFVIINAIEVTGDKGFAVETFAAEKPSGDGKVNLDPPETIDSNSSIGWTVSYLPQAAGPAAATLTIFSNDPSTPGGRTVKLTATAP